MKLIIYTNPNKHDADSMLLKLKDAAKRFEAEIVCAESILELPNVLAREHSGVKAVVTLGGDGTILRAASCALPYGIPVLGVNLGRVGFFSEISVDGFDSAFQKLIDGDYFIEQPTLVECALNGESMGECLNDFVLHRQELSSITHISFSIDDDEIGDLMADGIIISTPSGSTAYTLSAGGPVVAPKLDCILVTPICPHSLTVRPIVTSVDSVIKVRVKSECMLSRDGRNLCVLHPSDELVFKKSPYRAKFVRFEKRNIFKLIREKLR